MTIFSFSISTLGIWVVVLGMQLGFQFVHTSYEAPYLLIEIPWVRVNIARLGIQVQVRVRGISPPVWRNIKGVGLGFKK